MLYAIFTQAVCNHLSLRNLYAILNQSFFYQSNTLRLSFVQSKNTPLKKTFAMQVTLCYHYASFMHPLTFIISLHHLLLNHLFHTWSYSSFLIFNQFVSFIELSSKLIYYMPFVCLNYTSMSLFLSLRNLSLLYVSSDFSLIFIKLSQTLQNTFFFATFNH